MKINEVESILGITKANIRFYEKEGLLSPARTPNGYRDYGEGDIARLKQIIILRKLGIPVQSIADILDGALPLQEALDESIQNIQAEMEKLSGSLALCQQLKQEGVQQIDPDRCWDLIEEKQKQGQLFVDLKADYADLLLYYFTWGGLPGLTNGEPVDKEEAKFGFYFFVAIVLIFGGLGALLGMGFWRAAGPMVVEAAVQILIIGLFLLPAYIFGHYFPQHKQKALRVMHTLLLLTALGVLVYLLTRLAAQ